MPTQYSEPKMVVVKFSEEAQARMEHEALATADDSLSAGLEQLLATHADFSIAPLFTEPAANVSPEASSAASDTDAPNLNLYFRIDVDAAGAEQLVEELRKLPGVRDGLHRTGLRPCIQSAGHLAARHGAHHSLPTRTHRFLCSSANGFLPTSASRLSASSNLVHPRPIRPTDLSRSSQRRRHGCPFCLDQGRRQGTEHEVR